VYYRIFLIKTMDFVPLLKLYEYYVRNNLSLVQSLNSKAFFFEKSRKTQYLELILFI